MLRNVSTRELGIGLLGIRLPAPVLLAPIGVQGLFHPEGELAVGRAAASLGLPYVLSTVSSRTLEEVAAAMGDAPRWFQLYCSNDRELAASLVARAERAGYGAIVLTLDTPLLGWRDREQQNGYFPQLSGEGIVNYLSDPVFRRSLARPPEEDLPAAICRWCAVATDPSLTWDNLTFVRRLTRLPILLKGILHREDAARAVEAGMDGVIVSNHGGRQVDGAVAALDALPDIVETVAGQIPVLFDSGIRRGPDVVKALALGSKAVLLGRPYVWGLAVTGESGVREVLRNLLADLDITLGLSGHARVDELTPAALVRQPLG
jgi:lactate 2-monooxygenase